MSGNYFEVLGVGAHLGRTLTSQDDTKAGAHRRSQFVAGPAIVGRAVRINGNSFEVAGVAESSFRGMQLGFFPAVYVPFMMKRQMTSTWDGLFDRHTPWLCFFARLKPDVSRERAQAALQPYYHAALEEDVRQLTGVVSARKRRQNEPVRATRSAGGMSDATPGIHAHVCISLDGQPESSLPGGVRACLYCTDHDPIARQPVLFSSFASRAAR